MTCSASISSTKDVRRFLRKSLGLGGTVGDRPGLSRREGGSQRADGDREAPDASARPAGPAE